MNMETPSSTETLPIQPTTPKEEHDSALADLTEMGAENWIQQENALGWLKVRGALRAQNVTHQNFKDTRRRLGREMANEVRGSSVDEEMKINSPTNHVVHNYPIPSQPIKSSNQLLRPLLNLAAATVLGGSGLGAAWMVADALFNKPVATGTDTNSTLLQQFQDQNVEWAK